MSLSENLELKKELRFREDGTFRILMLSDMQETLEYDERSLRDMDKLVEREKPDLVLLGGDFCNGLVLKTVEELSDYLDLFTAPMEKRGIPWAHVFGNHDHDIPVDAVEKTLLYERYAHCVSKHTTGIHGTTNFMLPIKAHAQEKICFCVYGMDTGNRIEETGLPYEEGFEAMRHPRTQGPWDFIHFDQLMWYWKGSEELEKHCGGKVSALMLMHIAPWEFQYVVDNPEQTGCKGSTVEQMNIGYLNSGLFATVLQRGDVKCIACGHSHEDCFEGEYAGVKMCLDACAGYSPYGIDALRGGRVFVLNEAHPEQIETHMVHYSEL